jgi:hypothetical protein
MQKYTRHTKSEDGEQTDDWTILYFQAIQAFTSDMHAGFVASSQKIYCHESRLQQMSLSCGHWAQVGLESLPRAAEGSCTASRSTLRGWRYESSRMERLRRFVFVRRESWQCTRWRLLSYHYLRDFESSCVDELLRGRILSHLRSVQYTRWGIIGHCQLWACGLARVAKDWCWKGNWVFEMPCLLVRHVSIQLSLDKILLLKLDSIAAIVIRNTMYYFVLLKE